MSGTAWGGRRTERDREAIGHLLTCPRCAELCPGDCRYCSECGSRLLPGDCYIELPLDAPYPDDLHSGPREARS